MSSCGSCSYTSLLPIKKPSNCLQRLKNTYKKHKSKPLPPVFKPRIDGPSPIWKVFKQLQLAATYADSFTKDCMIFSYEGKVDNNGQRMFLVTHPKHMWLNYKARPPEERCSYEIIRESYPCKLYFDLEYYTHFNPEKDGVLMTKIFIKCIIAAMVEQHNLKMSESDFLWLDASTKLKYSCHLILQMKSIAFKNNIQAGIFVLSLLSTLKMKINNSASSEDLWPPVYEIKSLLVKSKGGNEMFFCDEGVYSKNRNFRMYLSTKPGKNAPLCLSPHNLYTLPEKIGDKEEIYFYDSLITYFRDNKITRLLCFEDENSSNMLHNISIHMSNHTQNKRYGVSDCTSSPFPDLDAFVLRIIKDAFIVGFIRKWTYLGKEQKIVYDIGNYRFCHNIGRHHKSNNIKIIVDMKARVYYQTCLDPECRHQCFQSEAISIPEDIAFVNVPDDFFDVDCFSQQVDYNEVNNNCIADKIPKELFITGNDDLFLDPKCTKYDETQATYSEDLSNQLHPFNFEEQNEINNSNSKCMEVEDIEQWNNFFDDDFSCVITQEDDKNSATYELINKDATSQFSGDFWCTESQLDNIKSVDLQLCNISFEEELLMAQAADAAEVAFDDDIFSEESVF